MNKITFKKINYILLFIPFVLFAQDIKWAKKIGGNSTDIGYSTKMDADGNVFVGGKFSTTTDFDTGQGVNNITSNGTTDAFIAKLDPQGNLIWAKTFGGSQYDVITDIQIDDNGNVYAIGEFWDTINFDAGNNNFNLTSNGAQDIFILKLDNSGNLIWARSFGGNTYDFGKSIDLDQNGNIYTVGTFRETVDFNPGQEVYELTGQNDDIFIHKMDNDGNFIWAKKMGSNGIDRANKILIKENHMYLTGSFFYTVDFDTSNETYNLISLGGADIFIGKFDLSGNLVWVKQMGSDTGDSGVSLALDSNDNVFVIGYFQGTCNFDPGASNYYISAYSGNTDIFLTKFDNAGNYTWTKRMGGSSYDTGSGIAIDNQDKIYVLADFRDNLYNTLSNIQSAGLEDIFIAKIDQGGNYLSTRKIGGTSYDNSYSIATNGVTLSIVGSFIGTSNFNPEPYVSPVNLYSTSNSEDVFILTLEDASLTHPDFATETVNVYPTLVNDYVFIETKDNQKTATEIYNTLGKQMIKTELQNIDLTAFERGIYFLKINTESGSKTIKIIKE